MAKKRHPDTIQGTVNREVDDTDRDLLAKCREAVENYNNDQPMTDVLTDQDFHDAVCLLVRVFEGWG